MQEKHKTIVKTGQIMKGEMIARADGYLLRASVRKDGYPPQSYAKVEIMTEAAGWKFLASMDLNETKMASHSYTEKKSEFEQDMNVTLRQLILRGRNILA